MHTPRFSPAPIPDDVRSVSRVILENELWAVGLPLTSRAMHWWGAFTDWCVAADNGLFADYIERGPLIVFLSYQTDARWALHPTTGEFRNAKNRRVSWSGFVMRHPEIVAELLAALPSLTARPSATFGGPPPLEVRIPPRLTDRNSRP